MEYNPPGIEAGSLFDYTMFNNLQVHFFICGLMTVSYFSIRIIDMLCDFWARKSIPIESFGADKSYWAVVTGSSDGIGKEIALQLADKGYNLVLLSRTQSKLEAVRDEILSKGVQVDMYAVDFSKTSEEQWRHIEKMLSSKPIGILVNNVAVSHPAAERFDEEDAELCNQIVRVNIATMVTITRFVVPQMRARNHGCILNIGSWACIRGLPFLSVYAGTKGFVKTFSQSLAYELKPEGIVVQHIISFWVTSKMSGYKKPTAAIPTPELYVNYVLNHIGQRCGTMDSFTSVPYPPHSFLTFVVSAMWDSRLTPPIMYDISYNIYKLAARRRERYRRERELLKGS